MHAHACMAAAGHAARIYCKPQLPGGLCALKPPQAREEDVEAEHRQRAAARAAQQAATRSPKLMMAATSERLATLRQLDVAYKRLAPLSASGAGASTIIVQSSNDASKGVLSCCWGRRHVSALCGGRAAPALLQACLQRWD
jgi:hypothetical protein